MSLNTDNDSFLPNPLILNDTGFQKILDQIGQNFSQIDN